MERYRVNYTLLIGLVVGAVVLGGGTYVLLGIQAEKNADNLLKLADEAEEAGDIRKAQGYLFNYTQLREDDVEADARLTRITADIGELRDSSLKERSRGYVKMESFLMSNPDYADLRQRLVDLLVKNRNWQDALGHINYLLNNDPQNFDLQLLKLEGMLRSDQRSQGIEYGYKLVGYDKSTGEFGEAGAHKDTLPRAYLLLALAVREDRGDPEVADAIIERMVSVSPELPDAYVMRGQYLSSTKRSDESKEDFNKALELDKENVNALMALAQLSMTETSVDAGPDEQYQEAYDLLLRAKAADAKNYRVYDLLARLELNRGDYDAALAHYDAGIKALDETAGLQLAFDKADMQLNKGDIEAVKASVAELAEKGLPQPFVDYLNARVLVVENQWFKASEELARLQPILSQGSNLGPQLTLNLAICYERLGQLERALESYELVLQSASTNRFAKLGRKRLMEKLNPSKLQDEGDDVSVSRIITNELLKPEDQQDWDAVLARVDDYATKAELPPGMADLLKAEVYVRRGMYREAKIWISRSLGKNPDNLAVWRSGLRVIASDPEQGPVESLRKLDMVFEKFGDQPLLRLDKADFLIMLNDDSLPEQLTTLTDGAESWNKSEQVQLWKGMARRYAQIRDQEARRRCLTKVVELAPNELPSLVELFRSAVNSNDAEKIAASQERILKLVGSRENPTYLLTEATRLLWEFARGAADKNILDKADKLVERALLKRADWHELYLTKARLNLARGDKTAALAAFQQALDKGPANTLAVLQHVSLLLERGRYVDASAVLDRINKAARQRLFGRKYAEILLNTGAINEALLSADEVLKPSVEDAGAQLWFGQFQLRVAASNKLSDEQKQTARDKADEALQKAIELAPENRDAWIARIGYLLAARRPLEAEGALQQAQLVLSEDQLTAVRGSSYASLGRWFDAENVYKQALEQNPDNIGGARVLASFYLSQRYPKPVNVKLIKASPLLNQILKAGADPEKAQNPTVQWARRTAAELLARENDYQKLLDAERLLASNVVNDDLSENDKLQLARILGKRPEPVSRVKAIRLLEELQRNRVLATSDDLLLGQLYYSTDNWNAARSQMLETIARNPNVPGLRVTYVRMLLNRGDATSIADATRQLKKLQEIAPTADSTLQLVVRVAIKSGQQRQARQALYSLLPKDLKTAEPQSLIVVAQLLTELDDLDRAEQLYRLAASKNPGAILLLADFLGSKRTPEKGFEILDKVVDDIGLAPVIRGGLEIIRARRDEVGGDFDGRVQAWLDKALREDPESIPLQLQLAGLRELQKRAEEAGDLYRSLLKQPELVGLQRAVVLNNLAYLLALSGDGAQVAEEALGYVAEAIEILGPQADILDTRAVVYTSLGRYREATKDIDLALTDNPTASKYFHKARNHMLAGDINRAAKAWEKAVDMGLTRDTVALPEREQYDQLKDKITGRTTQSVSR